MRPQPLSLIAAAPLLAASLGLAAPAPGPRLPAGHLKVPLIAQATSYSCGAAAMMAVLLYWELIDRNESSLYKDLGTDPEEGTDPVSMRDYARKLGLEAELRTGQTIADLEEALRRGATAIVDFQAWAEAAPGPDGKIDYGWEKRWEDGHYAVLVGADADYLYFMDPSTYGRYAYMPRGELMSRWRDYESRTGKRVEYLRMAIYIRGKKHLDSVPAPPTPLL